MELDKNENTDKMRQFIMRMHGKSPQEVLGAIAQSGLTRGIVISAIGAFVILVVFTVGPYMINRLSVDNAPPVKANPQSTATQTTPVRAQTDAQEQIPVPEVVPDQADLQKATDSMGIGESKTADPDKNPLEKRLDSLLDGVD